MEESVSLKEYLEAIISQSDSRYNERFNMLEKTLDTAIKTQVDSVAVAFGTSEKALDKASQDQKEYNIAHNDLSHRMELQYKEMIPRVEFQFIIDKMDKDINGLRETRSENHGKSDGLKTTGIIIYSVIATIVSIISLIAYFAK